MSKISDEVREFVRRSYADEHMDPRELLALADRVDRETMPRPRAADGKPLVDGETVYDSNGRKYHVNEVYPLVNVSTSTHSCSMFPDRFTHERPDSFERIADELDEMVDAANSADDRCEKLADLADRIRKLAKERGDE